MFPSESLLVWDLNVNLRDPPIQPNTSRRSAYPYLESNFRERIADGIDVDAAPVIDDGLTARRVVRARGELKPALRCGLGRLHVHIDGK